MTAPTIPQIALYRQWLKANRGLSFDSFEDDAAMVGARPRRLLAQHLGLLRPALADAVSRPSSANARCLARSGFRGAQVNYARQVFRHVDAAHAAGLPAIVSCGEDGELVGDEHGRSCGVSRAAACASPARARREAGRPDRCLSARTSPRPSSRFSPPPASARSGASARPTWRRPP